MIYQKVFREFARSNLKYLVIGGIAVNLHGFARATADLDIIISLDEENIKKFIKAAKSLALLPRIPVKIEDFADKSIRKKWIEEKNLQIFSLINPQDQIEQIDVMILNYLDFAKAYQKREEINVKEIKIPLAAIDDLIKLKTIAARERDSIDIKALRQIKEIKNEK